MLNFYIEKTRCDLIILITMHPGEVHGRHINRGLHVPTLHAYAGFSIRSICACFLPLGAYSFLLIIFIPAIIPAKFGFISKNTVVIFKNLGGFLINRLARAVKHIAFASVVGIGFTGDDQLAFGPLTHLRHQRVVTTAVIIIHVQQHHFVEVMVKAQKILGFILIAIAVRSFYFTQL